MKLSNTKRLTSKGSASNKPTSETSAIVHVSQQANPRKMNSRQIDHVQKTGTVSASTVDLRDEMVNRFRGYYQQFVGYPAVDFQPPANTTVRYSLLNHTGTHPWEMPAFKAGVAGFGSIVTTLSVGVLLSDNVPNPLTADPVNYSLPSDANIAIDSDKVAPEALDVSSLTAGDRPATLNPIEFSSSPDLPNIQPELSAVEQRSTTQLDQHFPLIDHQLPQRFAAS